VAVLGLLGSVVIYALVLGDVEVRPAHPHYHHHHRVVVHFTCARTPPPAQTRTYEMGMLRALGLKHGTLGQLLTIQTASFAVPGIAAGLFVSSMLNFVVVAVMRWFAAVQLPWGMYPGAWIFAVVLGVCVPALAVIVPIQRALTATLRDALDISHNVVNDVTVRMQKLTELGLSPAQLALAVMLVAIGFTTFYLLPLAFLFR
jgi:predicted lysophospholipase L1 biosynthesis ABC-type transport system permease subunit